MLGAVANALTACHAADGIDVKALVSDDTCGGLYLSGFQLAPHHHEDVAVLALMAYPFLVFVIADRRETDVHAQLGSLEQQFLHHLSRMRLLHADEDAEG